MSETGATDTATPFSFSACSSRVRAIRSRIVFLSRLFLCLLPSASSSSSSASSWLANGYAEGSWLRFWLCSLIGYNDDSIFFRFLLFHPLAPTPGCLSVSAGLAACFIDHPASRIDLFRPRSISQPFENEDQRRYCDWMLHCFDRKQRVALN